MTNTPKAPPRAWPDGRPVGGVNGYPEEYHQWALWCQAIHVAQLMLAANKGELDAIFQKWSEKLPGATREQVREALKVLCDTH